MSIFTLSFALTLLLFMLPVANETDSFCGSPGEPKAGSVFNDAERYKEGSIVGYKCDAYLFSGDLTRQCVNGTWSGQMPVCMETSFMSITPGNITGDSDDQLDHKWYGCNSSDSVKRIFCKLPKSSYIGGISIESWSASDEGEQMEFQIRITTPDGSNVYNKSYHWKKFSHAPLGNSFVMKFKEPVHDATLEIESIRLTENTTFKFTHLFILVIPGCGKPEKPFLGEVECSHDCTSITYKCTPGYRLSRNVVRQCQKSGIWTGEQARCVKRKLSCGIPGKPAEGIIKHFTEKDRFEEGDSFEYECFDGYSMTPSDNYRRTCINGSWTGQIPVCGSSYWTKSFSVTGPIRYRQMPYCLTVDNKTEFWKISLGKQYHVSSVSFSFYSCRGLCAAGVCGDYFNISVSNNSTTRYFKRWSFEPGGYCHFKYYMEDYGSPLANTISIAINKLRVDEKVPVKFCGIILRGTDSCGRPDSPLHSVFTFSNDNRTAFFDCKPGYRAVGNIFVSHCTDDLRWTDLNMKCMKSKELPLVDTETGANDRQLVIILVVPYGLLVFVLSTILGKILYRKWQMCREEQELVEELKRMKENRQMALHPDVPIEF